MTLSTTSTEKEESRKVIIPKIETETNLETLTDPEIVKPERKRTTTELKSARVILISPYSQLNVFLEAEIPNIIKGGELDIVTCSDFNKPPYIDVESRERHAKTPYLIIDFERITAEVEKEIKDKEKIIQHRRRSLADIINTYETEIREGIAFPDEFYLEQGKNLSSKITEIISKLTQSLDQKLSSLWASADNLIKVRTVTDVVEFNNYFLWAVKKGSINYMIPTKEFSKELESKHKYDKDGNFVRNTSFIIEYFDKIKKDIVKMEEYGKRARLELFNLNLA